jgi:hypothetical protein
MKMLLIVIPTYLVSIALGALLYAFLFPGTPLTSTDVLADMLGGVPWIVRWECIRRATG